ncbi:hypothetical protein F0L68_15105 [Solihabitans fulvus]|uniref:UspA domain-containing protein n=1 Tax=Solihabitans fulvus TaxID=1892852 RepID=A0A5B2XDT0_9PSEU|nr:universal stress protein [Solihabitans fulvus]KAA2261847.1 hypothetical protein F0L68_15105 [Solihabitans fulvus]
MTVPAAVVAGVPPAPATLDHLTWAARYAQSLGVELRLTHTYRNRSASRDSTIDPGMRAWTRLREIADQLRTRFPGLEVSERLVEGSPASGLVLAGDDARVIVVGHRTRWAPIELLGGSTAARVIGQARCPVVVVPPRASWTEPDRPIVVGVDDTRHSRRTLGHALMLAEHLGTSVRAVHCRAQLGTDSDLRTALSQLASRHPAVPVPLGEFTGRVLSALAWHAQFGFLVAVGSTAGGHLRRGLRRLLARTSRPVLVVGPHVDDPRPLEMPPGLLFQLPNTTLHATRS